MTVVTPARKSLQLGGPAEPVSAQAAWRAAPSATYSPGGGTTTLTSNMVAATSATAGFADATGRFLPLVCTLNAARVLTSTASMLGVDFDGLAALARSAEPGSGGLVLLPYFDGERTPNLPDARGSLHGITRDNFTPANVARAAIEGMFGGLADAVDGPLR